MLVKWNNPIHTCFWLSSFESMFFCLVICIWIGLSILKNHCKNTFCKEHFSYLNHNCETWKALSDNNPSLVSNLEKFYCKWFINVLTLVSFQIINQITLINVPKKLGNDNSKASLSLVYYNDEVIWRLIFSISHVRLNRNADSGFRTLFSLFFQWHKSFWSSSNCDEHAQWPFS